MQRRPTAQALALKKRATKVTCKCRSHCSTFNPNTGRYEGGKFIPRSTRDSHTRDDRSREILIGVNTSNGQRLTASNISDGKAAWISLANAELDTFKCMLITSPNRPLVFWNKPADNGEFVRPTINEMILPNHGLHSLTADFSNRQYLFLENRYCDLHALARLRDHSAEMKLLMEKIENQLNGLACIKEVEWNQQRDGSTHFVNTEIHFQPYSIRNPVAQTASIVALVLQYTFFITRRASRTLLAGLRAISKANDATEPIVASIPIDPRPLIQHFRLDPVIREFLACPSCHFLYPYNPSLKILDETFPFLKHCNNRRTPESPRCAADLWKEKDLGRGHVILEPKKRYRHQCLKSWVGRLVSRPQMESLIENPVVGPLTENSPVDDIWRAQIFSELKDASGLPYFPGPPNEGRLIFSLSVDSFNPFYNKTAKQTASSTGIWMVLLNLPQHLRYLPENMFLVGVIPGPEKPSKEDIYPYLDQLVDDLLNFWEGVMFSRTGRETYGRLFKGMLIPLICDMLGARQVVGMGSTNAHYFCTFCDLDIDDIDVFDRSEWPAKDIQHIRQIANMWKNAPNVKAQQKIFDAYGIRWTPLLRLPYWNPVLFTVIDPMHSLDLNLLQNHCRYLFQIDTKHRGGDGASPDSHEVEKGITSKEHLRSLKKCVDLINNNDPNLIELLLAHPRRVLYTISVDNDILGENHKLVVGTKFVLANNIALWRKSPNYNSAVLASSVPTFRATDAGSHNGDEDDEEEDIGDVQEEIQSASDGLDTSRISRIIRHLINDEEPSVAQVKAYKQGSAATFEYLCGLLDIDVADVDKTKRDAKQKYYNKIINLMNEDNENCEVLKLYVSPDRTSVSDRAVLGKDVMEIVWNDMRRTLLPSWITAAPSNWGTSVRGKLSADNWRVICTIHLPITLIRIWRHDTGRRKELLSHFMHLIYAVRIANMRVTSPEAIKMYNQHIDAYTENIQALYPDQHLKPANHAALHIGDMLGLFGPSHSHSGHHYERYINFFHRMNTNSKPGQLESTFLYTASRSANLNAILSDNETIRRSVQDVVSVMGQINREDARGFRYANIIDPTLPNFTPRYDSFQLIDNEILRLLCEFLDLDYASSTTPKLATVLDEISIHGVCYASVTSRRFHNSSIIFQPSIEFDATQAGTIDRIFSYSYPNPNVDGENLENIFLAIQELSQIPSNADPYRKYGMFAGFICSAIQTTTRVILMSQVVSHFASTKLYEDEFKDCIHVLPLDRLMIKIGSFDLPDLNSLPTMDEDLDLDEEGND